MNAAVTESHWLSAEEFDAAHFDHWASERFDALGPIPCVFVQLSSNDSWSDRESYPDWPGIAVGVDTAGVLPAIPLQRFDILLTTRAVPPRPWVAVSSALLDETLELLTSRAMACPLAATTLARVLRAGQGMHFDAALQLESHAYSALLFGPEFRRWRDSNPPHQDQQDAGPLVRLSRGDQQIVITLTRGQMHNAFSVKMREELAEALRVAATIAEPPIISLTGEGPSFCSGGDVNEFGTTPDPATAHAIRMRRSCALLVHCMASRVVARLHGACIGAGIEIPAAAGRVTAAPDTRIALPEIGMGLIPGAGGTVTVPRRIGHQRACYLALSGAVIGPDIGLAWGLIDALESGTC